MTSWILSLQASYGAIPRNWPRQYPRTWKHDSKGGVLFSDETTSIDADCTTLSTLIPVGMAQTPAVGFGQCFSTGGVHATGGTTRWASYRVNLVHTNLYYRVGEKCLYTCAHITLLVAYMTSVTCYWWSLPTLSVAVSTFTVTPTLTYTPRDLWHVPMTITSNVRL
jgi:hypothetical protein